METLIFWHFLTITHLSLCLFSSFDVSLPIQGITFIYLICLCVYCSSYLSLHPLHTHRSSYYFCRLTHILSPFSPRHSERVLEGETGALRKRYLEYVEGARQYLEGETDKDNTLLQIKSHFCEFVRKLIASFSCELLRFWEWGCRKFMAWGNSCNQRCICYKTWIP